MKTLSMRGKSVDMASLMAQNSQKIALGNANMNARGDIIGPGGKVVKPREQLAREYHRSNPKAVKQVALRDIKQEVMDSGPPVTPAQAMEKLKKDQKSQRKIVDSK